MQDDLPRPLTEPTTYYCSHNNTHHFNVAPPAVLGRGGPTPLLSAKKKNYNGFPASGDTQTLGSWYSATKA